MAASPSFALRGYASFVLFQVALSIPAQWFPQPAGHNDANYNWLSPVYPSFYEFALPMPSEATPIS
jgi:hypothetical protein